MSVSTYAGQIAVAQTPLPDSSRLTDRTSDMSAALVAPYTARSGSAYTPVIELSATTFAPVRGLRRGGLAEERHGLLEQHERRPQVQR